MRSQLIVFVTCDNKYRYEVAHIGNQSETRNVMYVTFLACLNIGIY